VRDELPTHKLDVLRAHCDDVGRDYDTIEKTAMVPLTPETTASSLAALSASLADIGFTANYVFAVGIDEPSQVVDVIRGAIELE
jgi:hypothetical protein